MSYVARGLGFWGSDTKYRLNKAAFIEGSGLKPYSSRCRDVLWDWQPQGLEFSVVMGLWQLHVVRTL